MLIITSSEQDIKPSTVETRRQEVQVFRFLASAARDLGFIHIVLWYILKNWSTRCGYFPISMHTLQWNNSTTQFSSCIWRSRTFSFPVLLLNSFFGDSPPDFTLPSYMRESVTEAGLCEQSVWSSAFCRHCCGQPRRDGQDNQDNSTSIHQQPIQGWTGLCGQAGGSLRKHFPPGRRSTAEGFHPTSTSCPPQTHVKKRHGHLYLCESLFPCLQKGNKPPNGDSNRF